MHASVLRRIADGDSNAVEDCIGQYGTLVWSIARRLSRTPADAEDATQAVFIQIWRQAARFDAAQSSERVFVALIARRCLIDRLRKRAAESVTEPCGDIVESAVRSGAGSFAERSLKVMRRGLMRIRQIVGV